MKHSYFSILYFMLKSMRIGKWSDGLQKLDKPCGSLTGVVYSSHITSAKVIRSNKGCVQYT